MSLWLFSMSCNSFYFYIKPQPLNILTVSICCCNSFYFYIKPQLFQAWYRLQVRCNSFYFYIKPQHNDGSGKCSVVVIHSISTSNHNWKRARKSAVNVVIHSISTSNHNWIAQFIKEFLVVIHSISTSNHNSLSGSPSSVVL